ncbi:unnamed protein product [Arctia plantaginis]|uniref:Uncharacterized protein n=1 Tax=Arctia plantaginis TaxID=874455 RepID=A0A8S0ZQJ8_ARCPL|nr:unnamed protein product [Arctia plantaginis]
MVIKNKTAPTAVSPIGTKKVGHARCTFAVDDDSRENERVSPERPRRQLVSPPATCRRAHPAPSPLKKGGHAPVEPPQERVTDVIVVRPTTAPTSSSKQRRLAQALAPEPTDVIDLGAPRLLRTVPPNGGPRAVRPNLYRASYIPNPRLYPGPVHAKPKAQQRQVDSRGGGEGRGRRRKRVFRRTVPNPRLYQPVPPAVRRVPPPAFLNATWSPPVPSVRLDTASDAAFRLNEQRRGRAGPPPSRAPSANPAPPLVVTLPPVATAATHRYVPASAHFRLRSLDTDVSGDSTPVGGRVDPSAFVPIMDAGNRKSTSPEDCSDGNDTLSAPSEFLAEFLSSIMRRQYAEALKYCRLILQYEPHNATARGFYPLLQQKVQAQKRPDAECPRGSSSEETSAPAADLPNITPTQKKHEMMEQGGDSSEESEGSEGEGGAASRSFSRSGDSCRSQSSLELDSSEALGHSSPSLSLSRRTEQTDSASAGVWDSTGSASRSDTDDNGNATCGTAPVAATASQLCAGDLHNDNAPAAAEPHKAELSALQRLRAQFTCSIK